MQPAQVAIKRLKGALSWDQVLLAFSSIGTLLLLGWALKFASFGIDFTDESFYLVWISNPFLYDWSLSQFGYIYHPLYLLLDGDVASLRRANILITFGLSWTLTGILLSKLATENACNKPTIFVVAAGFAVSSLTAFSAAFGSWLATPSYNSLTLQALLISSIGVLWAIHSSFWKSVLGCVLLGLGGWLAFMAKPSTALALAIGILFYLALVRKATPRLLLLSIVTAIILLILGALWIDGSVYVFTDRLEKSMQFASEMGSGHTLQSIVRLDDFKLNDREQLLIGGIATLTLLATFGAYLDRPLGKLVATVISLLFLVVVIALSMGLTHKTPGLGRFQGLLIWGVVLPAVVLGLSSLRRKSIQLPNLTTSAVALLFMAMPHIYAFGTNNNYWRAGSAAAIFWLLAGTVFLAPLVKFKGGWNFALPLVFATQLVTATILQTGLGNPYRQPAPLRFNDQSVEFGRQGSSLMLSRGFADYVKNAKNSAHKAGLQPGTPVIDLTGQSPGVLYALKAENVGQPWIIGGYPGSQKGAEAILSHVPCEALSSSWLLIEPSGPRSISDELLAFFGARLSEHYIKAASWKTAEGAGGYLKSREQILYKPVRQADVLKACHASKEIHP